METRLFRPFLSGKTLRRSDIFRLWKCFTLATEKSCKLHHGGNPARLNASAWLKARPLWLWLWLFCVVVDGCCVSDKKLCPVWPVFGPSSWLIDLGALCPGKSISAFWHGRGRCSPLVKWHKLLRGSCVLVNECVCVPVLHSVSFMWLSCLKGLCPSGSVLSATFVFPIRSYRRVYTTHAQFPADWGQVLLSTIYVRIPHFLNLSFMYIWACISKFRFNICWLYLYVYYLSLWYYLS